MYFDVLTLFPGMFTGPLQESIIGRARKKDIIDVNVYDIRNFTDDKHNTADDYPYGGGAGMVMKIEPVYKAWEEIRKRRDDIPAVILFTPQGRRLDQQIIKEYSRLSGAVLICGHYEGPDERIRQSIVTDEISLGDYVLTGGELPAMVFIDAVARMIPGVLGDEGSKEEDSFYNGLLDYPHYTRPREYRGLKVPGVLLSGHHARIAEWRRKQALKRTLRRRPDLLENVELSPEDRLLLSEIREELKGVEDG